jgi:hypothetical protein
MASEWEKLESLCRYIARPAVSTKRLSLTRNGQVRYELKTPYSNGTTHVLFEPLDFIARLVALVPRPGVNLTCYHGLSAPQSKYRAVVILAKQDEAERPEWVDSRYKRFCKTLFRSDSYCGYARADNPGYLKWRNRPGAIIFNRPIRWVVQSCRPRL